MDEPSKIVLSASEQLSYCTVQIRTDKATGTGFYYRFEFGDKHPAIPAIVTNKHVCLDASTVELTITVQNSDGTPSLSNHLSFKFEDLSGALIHHPSPDIDLCTIGLAPIISAFHEREIKPFWRWLNAALIPSQEELERMNPVEDIVMVGYPNGLWDRVNNQPIFRRGITATHPRFEWNGKPEFLIDAACFPGSSGSPVLLLNEGSYTEDMGDHVVVGATRLKLLGILYAGPQYRVEGDIEVVNVPIQDRFVATSNIPTNLGFVIRAAELLVLQKEVEARVAQESSPSHTIPNP